MSAFADLHVHIARAGGRPIKIASSPRLTVAGVVQESAKRKGLDVVAIVDAHSPPVIEEIEAFVASGELEELPGGGLRWAGQEPGQVPGPEPGEEPGPEGGRAMRPLLLILASEVEVSEKDIGPVHYLAYVPDLETCKGLSAFLLDRVTNIALSSQRARVSGEELARWLRREGGFLVPAHVFTPYKGLFGQGGTDLGQVFSDTALEVVWAVELGLSADTAMAEMVPSLRPFTYLTNSDAHSPETIGRECNALDLGKGPPDFRSVAEAVKEGAVEANYGLDPRLGKYHRAYCPKCGFVAGDAPAGGTCPSCGKGKLVGGVKDRILALAGASTATPPAELAPHGTGSKRPQHTPGSARPPYIHVIPLRYIPGVGPATLRLLVKSFGTELAVLHEVPEAELAEVVGGRLARLITASRGGSEAIEIEVGAGGRYGRLALGKGETRPS